MKDRYSHLFTLRTHARTHTTFVVCIGIQMSEHMAVLCGPGQLKTSEV